MSDKIGDIDYTAPIRPLPEHLQRLVDLLPLDQWVRADELARRYGNREYARRLRKVKHEYGWDIDTERRGSGANDDWVIRRSDGPVRPQHHRKEVPKAKRLTIYARDGSTCQLCGSYVGEGQDVDQPTVDHKIPQQRGGPTTDANLQTVCTRCNQKKRSECKNCRKQSCFDCPWAFPEKFVGRLVLNLSERATAALRAESRQTGQPEPVIVNELLERMHDASD